MYGAGVAKVAAMTKTSVGEARSTSRRVKATLFLDQATSFCRRVRQTLLLHRPVEEDPIRTLLNRTIQGTAADCLHISVERLHRMSYVRPMLTIHDEIWNSVSGLNPLRMAQIEKALQVELAITKESSLILSAEPKEKQWQQSEK